jgi:hypothetical protein
MGTQTLTELIFVGISAAIFAAAVVFVLLGHHYESHRRFHSDVPVAGAATIETAAFGLLGLLLAFSFAGAESRLQSRRELIVREVDAIGTAYLRIDLLPAADRPHLKRLFRDYVDARVSYYHNLLDLPVARAARARSESLQQRIWTEAVPAAARAPDMRATLIVVPALNEMFDVTMAREGSLWMHIPLAIFVLLAALMFACAFLAGMGMAGPNHLSYLHLFMFAGTMALTAYVILNLEFPRLGFVRLEWLDQFLVQLRSTMT